MIPVKNIYHMLAYAFQSLRESGYASLEHEEFEHVDDLYAAILARGVADLLRRGLLRGYIVMREDMRSPRGKVEVPDTLKRHLMRRQRLSCLHDEYTEDILPNGVLKATLIRLARSANVREQTRTELKRLLPYLQHVQPVDLSQVRWSSLGLARRSAYYRMLLAICSMAYSRQMQSKQDHGVLRAFDDTQALSALFERFVRSYIQIHFPQYKTSASYIKWALDPGSDTLHLPAMRTDLTMKADDRTVILDTKYYGHTFQTYYNKQTLHSGNLYQLLSYLDNAQAAASVPVTGVLLYARADEAIAPDQVYSIHGKRLRVQTLDLNCAFAEIETQLHQLVTACFS